jgi:hypothetical protein
VGALAEEFEVSPVLQELNAQLEFMGSGLEILSAEYITPGDGPEFGRTLLAKDVGNKQLGSHFVPFDTRRAWSGPGSAITWINDTFDGATASGLSAATTAAAIRGAMGTWQGVACSNLPLNDLGDIAADLGFVQFLLGFGGSPFLFADVTHGGWMPAAFFDALVPGGSGFILGVTFTFDFVGGDTNNDHRTDTAIREIYYNDNFSWAINGNIDVETVALHEAGHGLSQAHFGSIFLDNNGNLHLAPAAVMNAAYTGVRQGLLGTDNGGHCSNWGSWPN